MQAHLFKLGIIVLLSATFYQLSKIVTCESTPAPSYRRPFDSYDRNFTRKSTTTKWYDPERGSYEIRTTPKYAVRSTTPKIQTLRIRNPSGLRISLTSKFRKNVTPGQIRIGVVKNRPPLKNTKPTAKVPSKRRERTTYRPPTPKQKRKSTTVTPRWTTTSRKSHRTTISTTTTPKPKRSTTVSTTTTPKPKRSSTVSTTTTPKPKRSTTVSTTTTPKLRSKRSSTVSTTTTPTPISKIFITVKSTTAQRPVPYFPPPDTNFFRINVGPNYYQPHLKLPPLVHGELIYPLIINRPVFVSPGHYRFKEDSTLLGTYVRNKIKNVTLHNPTYKTNYAVIHHYHHYDQPIPRRIQVETQTLGLCGNLTAFCVPNTNALCLRNGTVFCIASMNLTRPCTVGSKNKSCLTTKLPCLNNTNCTETRTHYVRLPCISRIQFRPNFLRKYSIVTEEQAIWISRKTLIDSDFTDLKQEFQDLLKGFNNILARITPLINDTTNATIQLPQPKSTSISTLPTRNETISVSTETNQTNASLNATIKTEVNKTTKNISSYYNDLKYLQGKYAEALANFTRLTNGTSANLTNITLSSNGTSNNLTNITLLGNETSGSLANITLPTNQASKNITGLPGNTSVSHLGNTSSDAEINSLDFCVVLIAEPQPRRRKMTNSQFINYTNENHDLSRYANAKFQNVINKLMKTILF